MAKSVFKGRIRGAEADDLPVVLGMVSQLAAHHGDLATVTENHLARDVLGARPWVCVLLAELKGEILGYAALCPLAQLQFGLRGMDLQHLFVEPHARFKGVGRALIEAGQAHARAHGCRYLVVGTHADNAAAHNIYPAMGFDRMDPPGPRFRIALDEWL